MKNSDSPKFTPIRHPCPLGAMGPLYFSRQADGGLHCRKCAKPVADLAGQTLEQVRQFVAANPGKCIKIDARCVLRHE